MEVLKKLFEQHFHAPPEKVQPLQGELGGSGRKIIRLGNSKSSAVGILYGVREENVAFVSFARHFRKHGLPVPEIYGEDLAAGAYLEQDLGDTTLFEFLGKNRHDDVISPQVIEAYRKVVAELPRFQVQAGKDIDYSVCYPCTSFDRQSIHWDLNYFKYYFVRLAGIPFNESALEPVLRIAGGASSSGSSAGFLVQDAKPGWSLQRIWSPAMEPRRYRVCNKVYGPNTYAATQWTTD